MEGWETPGVWKDTEVLSARSSGTAEPGVSAEPALGSAELQGQLPILGSSPWGSGLRHLHDGVKAGLPLGKDIFPRGEEVGHPWKGIRLRR